ncbi:MAG: RNA methyltransferase [Terracidiphilus sp.]
MPVRIVQSKQNGRLKELRRAMAHPGREGTRLAGIEGPNLLNEALRAHLHIDCVFAAQEAEHLLEELNLPPEMDVLLVPRELLNSALATETPQPVAALVEPFEWIWRDILEGGVGGNNEAEPLVVVLAGLQDPGNLGTILRCAEAFGASGVVSLPGTVCAWNPKAVRASAGSVFRVPLLSATAEECFRRLGEAHVKVIATRLRDAAPADQADMAGPVALLIGNEGNGVPPELTAYAGAAITIPCPGPVESLNASVAAGILLYEASRQRSAGRLRGCEP